MRLSVSNAGRFATGSTFAGALVGFCEGRYQHVPPLYSTLLYAALWALGGLGLGSVLGYFTRRQSFSAVTWGAITAATLSAFVLVRFIVFRDIFMEAPEHRITALTYGVAAAIATATVIAGMGVLSERRWLLPKPATRLIFATPLAACVCFALLCITGKDDAFAQHEAQAPRPGDKQGVILVLVDALRADALSAYQETPSDAPSITPNLDAFAREGTVFTRGSAQASWTRPAMASVMTSRHVSAHNTMAKAAVLPASLPTLASVLQSHAVDTAAVVTNYNLTAFFGFDHGFNDFRYLPPARYLGAPPEANRLAAYNVYRLVRERYLKSGRAARYFYRDAATVNAQALDVIDHVQDNKFFVWLHYMEAHDPYFDSAGKSWAKVSDPNPRQQDAAAMRAAYLDGVQRFDTAFGDLMASLRARHVLEHTLVIVMSDHGEEFAEHGGFYHGTTLYEELVHIPMIMHAPALQAKTDTLLARQIDIAPTVAAYLGVPAPAAWEGTNLLAPGSRASMSLAEEDHEGNVLSSIHVATPAGGLKLIVANADNPRGLPTTALFDLGNDPFEKATLPDGDARILSLSAQMRDLRVNAQRGGTPSTQTTLDAPAKAELRALGYVQ